MYVTVVSRTESLFSGECTQVTIPAESGELGILSRHEPVLGVLGEGRLRLHTEGDVKIFKVKGGIYSVDNDLVTIAAHSGEQVEG
ncbi:F0F1 ATP synthase subunit epsilon [Boudabousia liubingyangii]|nr:F0F1 ATP synthase subunit epsilon [Boudabousia liubingyangii]